MLIKLTMNELKHLALQQLGLKSELSYHSSGMTNLLTPHDIEIVVPVPADEIPAYEGATYIGTPPQFLKCPSDSGVVQ